MNETPPCKTDPQAPHGCECEGWEPAVLPPEMVEKGTRAWADVANATEWVDDLRGSWEPDVDNSAHEAENVHGNVDNVNMSEERVHKTDKSIHEWVGLTPQEFNEIKDNSTTIGYAILQTEAKLKEKNT